PKALAESGQLGARGQGLGRPLVQSADYVVDRVAHGLEVLEVLVVDAEADAALAQLLLDRLHQLDQGEGVGVEVVGEGRALGDGGRLDLEDVGQAVADQLEDLLAVEWPSLHVGPSGHGGSWATDAAAVAEAADASGKYMRTC